MTKSTGQRARRGARAAWVEKNQGKHVCACGCGEAIQLRPEHFNVGVPRYRLGHNPQPKKLRAARKPCECGCGETASPGRRFVSGHNRRGHVTPAERRAQISDRMTGESNHRFGVTPHNFKGRQIHSEGYVLLFAPDHPFAIAGKKSVMEHRLVLETHLRATDPGSPYLVEVDGVLYLRPEIEVHHRDHDKANNVVENLQPLTKQEHARLHQAERNG